MNYFGTPNYYLGYYTGYFGALADLGEYLAAALDNIIKAPDANPVICLDPRGVLQPGLPPNKEIVAPLALSVRGKKINNVFTA